MEQERRVEQKRGENDGNDQCREAKGREIRDADKNGNRREVLSRKNPTS